jgi:uncharacterized protein
MKETMSPTALITGASGGIGYELAKLFARDGNHLVLVARSGDKLGQLAGELEKAYKIRATVVAVDLALADGPDQVFTATQKAGIDVDVLVNNAGFGQFGFYVKTDLAEELRQIQLNIASLTHLTKLYVRPMVEWKRGRILNVASTADVLSFSGALSNELRGTGVTVTCLCPGPTTTEFHQRAAMDLSNIMKAPFMDAKSVAELGYRAMLKGKPTVIAGTMNWLVAQSTRLAPRSWTAAVARKIQEHRQ